MDGPYGGMEQAPLGGSLIGGSDRQDAPVLRRGCHDLQPERQAIRVHSHRQADSRASGHVGQRAEVALRVGYLAAKGKRRLGRRRRNDGVDRRRSSGRARARQSPWCGQRRRDAAPTPSGPSRGSHAFRPRSGRARCGRAHPAPPRLRPRRARTRPCARARRRRSAGSARGSLPPTAGTAPRALPNARPDCRLHLPLLVVGEHAKADALQGAIDHVRVVLGLDKRARRAIRHRIRPLPRA